VFWVANSLNNGERHPDASGAKRKDLCICFFGSERESGEMGILCGFLKSAHVARNCCTMDAGSPKRLKNRRFAVEMTLRGRNDGTLAQRSCRALGAWKPAQNAVSHIPTATATTAAQFDETAKPAKIVGSFRFSRRTVFLKHMDSSFPLVFRMTTPKFFNQLSTQDSR
jgi:hypothetical protein